MSNDSKEIRLIRDELDRVYEELTDAETEPQSFDLFSDRFVIFSDQHRGARNGADDFRRCERAYNAALAYYYHMGYTLVVLGDAEELWEERPGPVIRTYRHTLELEARFHRDGRYLRVWGNHDDDWRFPDKVKTHLAPIFGDAPLPVPEGYLFSIRHNGERLGELLLVHGHQGSATSDRFAGLSKFFVRYLWRPIQRLTNYSVNTPSKDWSLRAARDHGMQQWAASQPAPTVVICGHTHRPVFASQSHADQLARELEAVRGQLETQPEDRTLRAEMSLLEAEIEWVRAQEEQERLAHRRLVDGDDLEVGQGPSEPVRRAGGSHRHGDDQPLPGQPLHGLRRALLVGLREADPPGGGGGAGPQVLQEGHDPRAPDPKRSAIRSRTAGGTYSETSPPRRATSRTREALRKVYWLSGAMNSVSTSGHSDRFICAIWNSYSKSLTARSPRTRMRAPRDRAKSTRRPEKEVTSSAGRSS